jgi:hypothetical protein
METVLAEITCYCSLRIVFLYNFCNRTVLCMANWIGGFLLIFNFFFSFLRFFFLFVWNILFTLIFVGRSRRRSYDGWPARLGRSDDVYLLGFVTWKEYMQQHSKNICKNCFLINLKLFVWCCSFMFSTCVLNCLWSFFVHYLCPNDTEDWYTCRFIFVRF